VGDAVAVVEKFVAVSEFRYIPLSSMFLGCLGLWAVNDEQDLLWNCRSGFANDAMLCACVSRSTRSSTSRDLPPPWWSSAYLLAARKHLFVQARLSGPLVLALLTLLLVRLPALSNTLEDLLTVLVGLELRDDDLAGRDADGHALAVGLLAGDALDLDEVLEAVDGGDLALTTLVGAAHDGDFVVLADGDRSDLEGTLERVGF
jgi:hypothetical protein